MSRADEKYCCYIVLPEYWRDYFGMIAKAIIERQHNTKLLQSPTVLAQSTRSNELKMPFKESHVLLKYVSINAYAIALSRDTMVHKNNRLPSGEAPYEWPPPANREERFFDC